MYLDMFHALLFERQELDLHDLMAAQDGEAVAAHMPREPGRRATPGRPVEVDFSFLVGFFDH